MSELRAAAVAMAATVAGFGAARLVEVHAHQDLDLGILAVFLAVTLARTERSTRSASPATTAVILALSAAAASEVGHLMSRSDDLGDGLFVATLAAAVWIRRFGPGWTKAGTVLSLPFVAALVTPYVPHAGFERDAWSAVMAVIVLGCVLATEALAYRTGLLVRPGSPAPRPAVPDTDAQATRPLLAPSTRLALQMAVALAAAFVVGRHFYPDHWSWPVLTAYIVGSGNRGRADVLYKSVLRTAGAVVGTVAATGISGQFPAGDKMSVVLIFAVLGLGSWLRSFNYAYWAACMTAALALLYGYFGQSGPGLLEQRLQGILAGAACGLCAAWFVFPVRTGQVVRRRTSNLLASLARLLTVVRDQPGEIDRRHAADVIFAIASLDQIAAPLRARRSLGRRWRSASWPADVIDAADACAASARTIVGQARQRSATLTDPYVVAVNAVTLDNTVAVREAIRSGSVPELRPLPEWATRAATNGGHQVELEPVGEAIVAVNGAVQTIADKIVQGREPRRLSWRHKREVAA